MRACETLTLYKPSIKVVRMSQKINFVPATLPVVQQKVFEVLNWAVAMWAKTWLLSWHSGPVVLQEAIIEDGLAVGHWSLALPGPMHWCKLPTQLFVNRTERSTCKFTDLVNGNIHHLSWALKGHRKLIHRSGPQNPFPIMLHIVGSGPCNRKSGRVSYLFPSQNSSPQYSTTVVVMRNSWHERA
jgi:hypothetical protein